MHSAVLIIVGVVAVGALVGGLRIVGIRSSEATPTSYTLVFPRNLSDEAVVSAVRSLVGLLPRRWRRVIFGVPAVILETSAQGGRVTHRLIAGKCFSELLVAQTRAAVPGLRIVPDDEITARRFSLAGGLRLSSPHAILRTDVSAESSASVLASLGSLRDDQEICVQWVVSPTAPRSIPRVETQSKHDETPLLSVLRLAFGRRIPTKDEIAQLRIKLKEPVFAAAGRLAVRAEGNVSRALLGRISSAFHVSGHHAGHLRRRLIPSALIKRRLERRIVPRIYYPAYLNASELAAVLGWPIGTPNVEGLAMSGCRTLPPSPEIPSTGGIELMRSNFAGRERSIAIPFRDLNTHIWGVGKTGGGKSNLGAWIIIQAMRAGLAVVVIDPAGDLIGTLLDQVPRPREEDIIHYDPSNLERPIPLNLLTTKGRDAELIADDFVALMRMTHPSSWGPRLEDALRASCITLARVGYSIAEVPPLLTNPAFRTQVRKMLGDDLSLQSFWQWFESLGSAEVSQLAAPILNKVRPLLMRERIRTVVGQTEATFTVDEVLNEGKILFVSAAKGLLAQDGASLIGGIVMSMCWNATLARARLAPSDRRPALIVIDEVQNFVGQGSATSLPDMLAEARKLNVGVVALNQSAGAQIPRDIRSALIANARSKIVFVVGSEDARILARELPPLEPEDLQGLARYEVAAALTVNGASMPTVTGTTLALPEPTGRGQIIKAMSAERYGRDRAVVEAEIRARQSTGTSAAGDVGEGARL